MTIESCIESWPRVKAHVSSAEERARLKVDGGENISAVDSLALALARTGAQERSLWSLLGDFGSKDAISKEQSIQNDLIQCTFLLWLTAQGRVKHKWVSNLECNDNFNVSKTDEQQTAVYMDQMRAKQTANASQALKRKALKQADADELEELREDKRRREEQQEVAPAPTPTPFADVAVRDAARLRQVLAALPLMSNANLKEVDANLKEQMKKRKI